jgi:hypothetical protein
MLSARLKALYKQVSVVLPACEKSELFDREIDAVRFKQPFQCIQGQVSHSVSEAVSSCVLCGFAVELCVQDQTVLQLSFLSQSESWKLSALPFNREYEVISPSANVRGVISCTSTIPIDSRSISHLV